GKDNREAALRFVQGSPSDPAAANVELKCFDLSANPYLLAGAVMAVAMSAAGRHAALPDEVSGDPGVRGHPQAVRLPASLGAALKALEANDDLRAAAGDQLISTFAASRRAEIELADGKSEEEIVAQSRWLLYT